MEASQDAFEGQRIDHLQDQTPLCGGEPGGALSEEPRPGVERKLSGKEEALLVAIACSTPPRRDGLAGPLSFWPTRWSNSPIMKSFPARPCADGWRRTI
jgi:hypothetical protein